MSLELLTNNPKFEISKDAEKALTWLYSDQDSELTCEAARKYILSEFGRGIEIELSIKSI
jgi:hypothetical protein